MFFLKPLNTSLFSSLNLCSPLFFKCNEFIKLDDHLMKFGKNRVDSFFSFHNLVMSTMMLKSFGFLPFIHKTKLDSIWISLKLKMKNPTMFKNIVVSFNLIPINGATLLLPIPLIGHIKSIQCPNYNSNLVFPPIVLWNFQFLKLDSISFTILKWTFNHSHAQVILTLRLANYMH